MGHFSSLSGKALHSEIGPLVMSIEPAFPFEFHFMDEAFDGLYQSEQRMSRLISAFTHIAIFVACLGLFGLSSYSANRRKKEVGVRKVMGASFPDIVRLLSKEYLILIGLANIIAWPVAYYLMNKWLQGLPTAHRWMPGFSSSPAWPPC